jgi:hypothetical protein
MDEDQLAVARQMRTAPQFKLLNQDNAYFAAQVCADCFQGEKSEEVSREFILSVIEKVRDRLNSDAGIGARLTGSAEHYLAHWMKDPEGVNWLGSRTNERHQEVVTFLPAAKAVVTTIYEVGVERSLTTDHAFTEFETLIMRAEARISGDDTHMRESLIEERDKAQRRLDDFERNGMAELTEGDKREYAALVISKIYQISNAYGSVVKEMRQHNESIRKKLQEPTDGPAVEPLIEVLEEHKALKKTPPFRLASTIQQITGTPDHKRRIDRAILAICDHCSDYLSLTDRRQAREFFAQLSMVSGEINREHMRANQQIAAFIDDPEYVRRNPVYSLLSKLKTRFEEVRDVIGPTERDPRIAGMGLRFTDFSRPDAAPAISAKLHYNPPVSRIAGKIAPPINAGNNPNADAEAQANVVAEEYLSRKKAMRRIRKHVEEHGDARLSEIIEAIPLRYGIREVALYLDLAATALPSLYTPDDEVRLTVREGEDTYALKLRNPIFRQNGPIAEGLSTMPPPQEGEHETQAQLAMPEMIS